MQADGRIHRRDHAGVGKPGKPGKAAASVPADARKVEGHHREEMVKSTSRAARQRRQRQTRTATQGRQREAERPAARQGGAKLKSEARLQNSAATPSASCTTAGRLAAQELPNQAVVMTGVGASMPTSVTLNLHLVNIVWRCTLGMRTTSSRSLRTSVQRRCDTGY